MTGQITTTKLQPRTTRFTVPRLALRERSANHPMVMFAVAVTAAFASMVLIPTSGPAFASVGGAPMKVTDAVRTHRQDLAAARHVRDGRRLPGSVLGRRDRRLPAGHRPRERQRPADPDDRQRRAERPDPEYFLSPFFPNSSISDFLAAVPSSATKTTRRHPCRRGGFLAAAVSATGGRRAPGRRGSPSVRPGAVRPGRDNDPSRRRPSPRFRPTACAAAGRSTAP